MTLLRHLAPLETMSKRRYARVPTQRGDVLVDEVVLLDLQGRGFVIGFQDHVQHVLVLRDHNGRLVAVNLLHIYAWEYFVRLGVRRRPKPDEVIHHINGVLDNRIAKLDRILRGLHNRRHHRERRRYSPKEKTNLTGFYRPVPPIERDATHLIGKTEPYIKTNIPADENDWKTGMTAFEIDAEVALAGMLPELRRRLRTLETNKIIPKMSAKKEWRSPRTRRLGIRLPRLGCWPGEVALVLLAIEHGGVAGQIAEAADLHVETIKNMLKRPSVMVALERWRTFGRFPKPCPRRSWFSPAARS